MTVWVYDARPMATRPDLVPAFREPHVADVSAAEFETLVQTMNPEWIMSMFGDDQ